LIFRATTDPNGILAAGDVMNIYEDNNIDYDDSTQGLAFSTATDGSLLGSFAMPNPFDPGADSYWYTLAPQVPLGQGDVGEAFAGLVEGSVAFPWDFGPVNDPNENYSSNANAFGGAPDGVDVDFWINTELFGLGINGDPNYLLGLGDDLPMHFGSNDPGVFMPVRVPEPTTLALMGMGMLGLGIGRRRRKA
jgi:hypothetical protein